MASGTIHGHPITEDEFRKLTKMLKINFSDFQGTVVFDDFCINPCIPLSQQLYELKEDMLQVEFSKDMTQLIYDVQRVLTELNLSV